MVFIYLSPPPNTVFYVRQQCVSLKQSQCQRFIFSFVFIHRLYVFIYNRFFSFAEMPYFTSPPPATNRILELGASDTITCQATGIPQPVITWYRNGQPIDFTQQQRFLNFSENFFCYSVHSYDTVLISCMDTLEHTLSGMHCTLLA